jgi:hypothetical protein
MRIEQKAAAGEVVDTSTELAVLVAKIAHLTQSGGLDAVPLADLPALVAGLARAHDQLEAVVTIGVTRVHASGALPVSTTAWLRDSAAMTSKAASGVLARGCALAGGYSATGAAWLSDGISRAHVAIITTSIDKVARGLAHDDQAPFRAAAEQALLHYALDGATPAALAIKAKRVRGWVDEWGLAKDADETERAQFLRFDHDGDGVKVTGYLSPENHALIATALQQAIDQRHRDGTLPEEDRVEGDEPAAARQRRRRQPYLNVIALRDMCGALLENGDLGARHGVIPRATVDIDLHDLHSAFGGTLRTPGSPDGTHLGHHSVRRLMCDAEINAAIVTGARPRCTCGCPHCACHDSGPSLDDLLRDSAKEVLYVGRAHRVVTPRQRRALETRDRGRCSRPGCGVPAARCRAHHVVHWEDGGLTDLDNCLLVCDRHHHDLHEGGWSLQATPGKRPTEHGYFRWIPPSSRRP